MLPLRAAASAKARLDPAQAGARRLNRGLSVPRAASRWRLELLVVITDLTSILLVATTHLIVVRCFLDVLSVNVDLDFAIVHIDGINGSGRNHALLAEDPKPGVDDHERTANLI